MIYGNVSKEQIPIQRKKKGKIETNITSRSNKFYTYTGCNDVKTDLGKFIKAFQDSGLLRKVGLLRDLINTNLETSTSVEDYVNKIMSSAHKLRNIGFNVDDEWLGTLMLAGLPDEYKPMIMGIESSGVKISADLIKTKLLQEIKATPTIAESTTHLWHQRLGHLNYNDVHKLPNCTTGVKLSSQKEKYVCISCLEGKQTRQSFPSNGSRANGLLELVHTDTSNPYTPQQNGLSERMNRTLVERAKCMMFNADLSKNYWAEAVTTAAYIINRSPTHALSDITPHEVWTGQKPDLSNIRIFGCPAMVHIPKEKRQKLDMKSRQLIFVGYSECTKGYRFMDPKTNKAVISRDVHFLEENIKSKIVESTSFSAPETKINNINQEVHEIQQLKDKNNNEKNNNKEQKLTQIYLPLNEQKSELITQDHENTDEKEQSSPNITDTSSTIDYEDPLNETYLPSPSVNISPANETGIKTPSAKKVANK
ncbi:Retrovirus-related Pol polyprotein from transposon TNT 1-94 [Eumeta japonica]|uniref:Retrovirus-related Pol polyprotein from transposon TNT 1-94 n=1 Tax=Eumeta variegata TaxID=151549 RepID=A0A4C1ZQC8_EUMVA|nr:Retrovirus-related Pol polyprotein from transposon TNT 1-94 [Eumeta japonica]